MATERMTPTWPDGSTGEKVLYRIWISGEIGRGAVGDWQVEPELPSGTVFYSPGRKQAVPVYPASYTQELVEALNEIAAPNVCAFRTEDDDCLSLGAPVRCPRCIAVEALAHFNKTGEKDG